MKVDDMSDRELLLFLMGEVRWIKKMLENHLRHCWSVVIALVGIAGVAITSLLVALLRQ